MKQKFDYQPFDRVTVQINETTHPAVLFQNYSTFTDEGQKHFLEIAYVDPYGQIRERRFRENAVRPGHYDADGNWLPYPGEPCYYISTDGKPVQTMVFSVKNGIVVTLSTIGLYQDYYKVVGDKAVETQYFNGDDVGHDIPQSAFLHPGRIKTAEQ